MRLLDLEPMFCRRVIKVEPRLKLKVGRDPMAGPFADADFEMVTGPVEYREPVDLLADAHGISFLCPKCINSGGHSVICWFEDRVPADATPGPGTMEADRIELQRSVFRSREEEQQCPAQRRMQRPFFRGAWGDHQADLSQSGAASSERSIDRSSTPDRLPRSLR